MSVKHYLNALEAHLHDRQEDGDLLEEMRTHLEDCAHDLRLQGLSADQSEQEAVRRFGSPGEVMAAVDGLHVRHHWRSRVQHPRVRGAGLAVVLALALGASLGGGMAAAALSTSHPVTYSSPAHARPVMPYRDGMAGAHPQKPHISQWSKE